MNIDATTGAIAHLRNEWGGSEAGYSIEAIERGPRSATNVTVHVVHSDGSRFVVAATRHGVPCCPTCGEPYTWRSHNHGYDRGRWQPLVGCTKHATA